MEPEDSWLRLPEKIDEKLRQLAQETIPYAVALIVANETRRRVGNVDIMPGRLIGHDSEGLSRLLRESAEAERARAHTDLDPDAVGDRAVALYRELEAAVAANTPDWKVRIPGKPIFSRFAAAANMDPGRLKLLYLAEAAKQDFVVFRDILDIFRHFAVVSAA
jgi:hypothetical protein